MKKTLIILLVALLYCSGNFIFAAAEVEDDYTELLFKAVKENNRLCQEKIEYLLNKHKTKNANKRQKKFILNNSELLKQIAKQNKDLILDYTSSEYYSREVEYHALVDCAIRIFKNYDIVMSLVYDYKKIK